MDSKIAEIQACEDRLILAMKANDYKALNELIHEQLQFIIPNGVLISKEMDQENHRHVLRVRGAPGPTTAEESDLPERVRVQQQESPPPPPQLPRRLQD